MKNFDNYTWLPKHVQYRRFILSDKSFELLSTWKCNVFFGRNTQIMSNDKSKLNKLFHDILFNKPNLLYLKNNLKSLLKDTYGWIVNLHETFWNVLLSLQLSKIVHFKCKTKSPKINTMKITIETFILMLFDIICNDMQKSRYKWIWRNIANVINLSIHLKYDFWL